MRRRFEGEFPSYVPAAERRARIERERRRFAPASSVIASGNRIAKTFWGDAWCRNLERYGDFANRLPRGRSYLRAGSVLELSIAPGTVTARVLGTAMYRVSVRIRVLGAARWKEIRERSAGRIDSLVALLEGRLPESVLELVTDPVAGLFPAPHEIELDCTCPDSARVCKHVAAVLYGVGVRLDASPELFFTLRGVDHRELAAAAPALWNATPSGGRKVLTGDLSEVFGIELAEPAPETVPRPSRAKAAPKGRRVTRGAPARRKF